MTQLNKPQNIKLLMTLKIIQEAENVHPLIGIGSLSNKKEIDERTETAGKYFIRSTRSTQQSEE